MLERWTRTVLRFRVAVALSWLVIVVVGAWSSSQLAPLLSNSFAVPGTDAERADSLLADGFGEHPNGIFTVVFRVPRPSEPGLRDRLRRRVERAAAVVPTARVGLVGTGGGVVFVEVETGTRTRCGRRCEPARRPTRS